MVKTRKAEWSIVPDSYIMYPVTYKEQDRLLECACYDNQEIGNYMHYMDIRLQCETGVPFGKDGIDLMERYKNRLERIPLGRLRVRITLEMILISWIMRISRWDVMRRQKRSFRLTG